MAQRDEGVVGKLDEVAGRVAEELTADSQAHADPQRDVEARPAPEGEESGRGATLDLDGDAERRLSVGEELAVRLSRPQGGEEWGYEVDGEDAVVDVSQRAELRREGTGEDRPVVGDRDQFVLRAQRPGEATLRFQAAGRSIRLALQVD